MRINRFNNFVYSRKLEGLNESLINEELGFKDVLIGISALVGVVSGNLTKSQAQNKLNDKEVIQQIDDVLNDKEELKSVIDSLESRGMDDVADYIQNNAKEVKDGLKKWNLETIRTDVDPGDYSKLGYYLDKGWAISEITTEKVLKKIFKENPEEELVMDTLELDYKSNDLFEAGSFNISSNFKDSLVQTFDDMKSLGYGIIAINIESSTDKQRIGEKTAEKLEENGYDPSNKGLSESRNDKVKEYLESLFVDGLPSITQNVLFNQGKGVVGSVTEQDPSARYVKLTVYCVSISQVAADPQEDIEEVLIKSFKVVKPTEVEFKITLPSGKKVKKRGRTKKVNYEDCKNLMRGGKKRR